MSSKQKKSSPKGAGTQETESRHRRPRYSSREEMDRAGTSSAGAQGAGAQGAGAQGADNIYDIVHSIIGDIHVPHVMHIIAKQSYTPTNSQGWPKKLHDDITEELAIRLESTTNGDIVYRNEPVRTMTYIEGANGEKIIHSIRDNPAIIYQNGTMEWYRNGKIHRENDPAIVIKDKDGNEVEWFWVQDGKEHRIDGPSHIYDNRLYNNENRIYTEDWCKYNKRHRDDNPAVIIMENGVITQEIWYRNDKIYRKDGPALTVRDNDGNIVEEKWYNKKGRYLVKRYSYKDRMLHSYDDEPAIIVEDGDDHVLEKHWYRDGKLHREGKPAIIIRDSNGRIKLKEWYKNGKLIKR